MSKGIEVLDVHQYLLGLRNDTVLRSMFPGGVVLINADLTKREPPPFYIVFSVPGDEDVNNISGERIMTKPDYMIQCIGRETGYEVLRPILERVEAIITADDAGTVVNGTYVGRFVRTNVVVRADSLNNVRWHYLAGLYKMIAYSVL